MTEELDWIALSGRRAKGKRPAYFEDPAVDNMLSIVMSLVAEVSALRQRLDTVERLLDERDVLPGADIEAYVPDADAAYQRGVATRAYIARVMRGVQQSMDAMAADDRPVEEVSRDLRDS